MPSIICNQGQSGSLANTKEQQAAKAKGFTKLVYIVGGIQEGEFLVQPDTDLDSRFKAFGCDWDEWVSVNGYNCEIEEI